MRCTSKITQFKLCQYGRLSSTFDRIFLLSLPGLHGAVEPAEIDFSSDDIIMGDVPYPYGESSGTNPIPLFHGCKSVDETSLFKND